MWAIKTDGSRTTEGTVRGRAPWGTSGDRENDLTFVGSRIDGPSVVVRTNGIVGVLEEHGPCVHHFNTHDFLPCLLDVKEMRSGVGS